MTDGYMDSSTATCLSTCPSLFTSLLPMLCVGGMLCPPSFEMALHRVKLSLSLGET